MPRLSVEDLAKRCSQASELKYIGFDHDALVKLIASLMGLYKMTFPDNELGREIAYFLLRSQPKGTQSG